jgi:hypothetical protein
VPIWVAIIVGLGSGLAGSVIGTVLTVSHERAAEFRSRMLLAAEDFLRRGETVRRFVRRPHDTTTASPLDVLLDAWDELVPAVVLVELLFGRTSESAHWAREAANELSDVEKALRAAIEADSTSAEPIEDHMLAAGHAMDRFGEVAASQVRRHRR